MSNDRSCHQWTPEDVASQVSQAAALAVCIASWLRDEEASYPDLADWLGG